MTPLMSVLLVATASLLASLLTYWLVRRSYRPQAAGSFRLPTSDEDDVLLGFPTTIIEPDATAQIRSCTQVDLRIRRLVLPSDIAGMFLVNDVRVTQEGTDVQESLLATACPVPGRIFSEMASTGACCVMRRCTLVRRGQSVILNVTNVTGGKIMFNAAVLGAMTS